MSVEVKLLGEKCNLQCKYCYQVFTRENGENTRNQMAGANKTGQEKFNLKKIKESIERQGRDFNLFGGEALLLPLEVLEELWAWGYEKFGKNGLQTNGTLVTDAHIELFKKYKVGVGFSIDGPGELNDVRWAGSLKKTRAFTDQSIKAMEKLITEGVGVGLIITLHRGNGTKDKLPMMNRWLKKLDDIGLRSCRIHTLEVETDSIRDELELTVNESIRAMVNFMDLQKYELKSLKFDVFKDIRSLLLGDDRYATCTWRGCDPYSTISCTSINPDGEASNCGRTEKEGISFLKPEVHGAERVLGLFFEAKDSGGCNGCRFFLMCQGYCPGSGIDGDWRNRSEACKIVKELFSRCEKDLIAEGFTPVSVADQRSELEKILIELSKVGERFSMYDSLSEIRKNKDLFSGQNSE